MISLYYFRFVGQFAINLGIFEFYNSDSLLPPLQLRKFKVNSFAFYRQMRARQKINRNKLWDHISDNFSSLKNWVGSLIPNLALLNYFRLCTDTDECSSAHFLSHSLRDEGITGAISTKLKQSLYH